MFIAYNVCIRYLLHVGYVLNILLIVADNNPKKIRVCTPNRTLPCG